MKQHTLQQTRYAQAKHKRELKRRRTLRARPPETIRRGKMPTHYRPFANANPYLAKFFLHAVLNANSGQRTYPHV